MAIDCIKLHAKHLIKEYNLTDDISSGDAMDIAVKEYKKLHNEIENFKKQINPKYKKQAFVSPDKSKEIKAINDKYDADVLDIESVSVKEEAAQKSTQAADKQAKEASSKEAPVKKSEESLDKGGKAASKPSLTELKSDVVEKAEEAKESAVEEGVSLKVQKDDLLGQVGSAIKSVAKIMEAGLPDDLLQQELLRKLKKAKFKTATSGKGKTQVVFDVEGDGTFKLAAESLPDALDQIKKHWKITEEKSPTIKSESRMPSLKAMGRYDTLADMEQSKADALDNLETAKKSGNKRLIEIYTKQAQLESDQYKLAKSGYESSKKMITEIEKIKGKKDWDIYDIDRLLELKEYQDRVAKFEGKESAASELDYDALTSRLEELKAEAEVKYEATKKKYSTNKGYLRSGLTKTQESELRNSANDVARIEETITKVDNQKESDEPSKTKQDEKSNEGEATKETLLNENKDEQAEKIRELFKSKGLNLGDSSVSFSKTNHADLQATIRAEKEPLKRKILQDIDKVITSLVKVMPDIKVVLHDSQTSFESAIPESIGLSAGAAFKDGAIHLNMENIYASGKTNFVYHEAVHPVLDALADQNPALIDKLYNELGNYEFGRKYKEFGDQYNDAQAKKEAIVEFIADVANGELNITPQRLPKVKLFFAKVLRAIGLGKLADGVTSKKQLIELAASINNSFSKGLSVKGVRKGTQFSLTTPNGKVEVTPLPEGIEIVNGFYSPLEKTIAETKFEKLPAKQWIDKLAKGEEAKWTGLNDWLSQQKEPVTKKQIQDFLKDNRIQVVEVVKDSQSVTPNKVTEEGDFDYSDQTKFSQYQLEGEKDNYKEILVTLPSRVRFADKWAFYKSKGYDEESFDALPDDKKQDLFIEFKAEDKKQRESSVADFKSSHFDEPNILAHLRMSTRVDAEGKKTLFIEEIQSDWGQKGRKEGFKEFKLPTIDNMDLVKVDNGNGKYLYQLKDKNGLQHADLTDFEIKAYKLKSESEIKKELYDKAKKYKANENLRNIPPAPFVTETPQWTKLALKTALQHAVKEGADKIAWTTGEQQNDRYDLSKQVDEIKWSTDKDGTYSYSAIKNGQNVGGDMQISANKLAEHIGKDAAEKIVEQAKDKKYGSLTGLDLKAGGKGMIGFYGSPKEGKLGIVGQVAESLFGKGSVRTTEIDTGKPTYDSLNDYVESKSDKNVISTQHSIDITPKIKAEVERGLPQFSKVLSDESVGVVAQAIRAKASEGVSYHEAAQYVMDELAAAGFIDPKDPKGKQVVEQAYKVLTGRDLGTGDTKQRGFNKQIADAIPNYTERNYKEMSNKETLSAANDLYNELGAENALTLFMSDNKELHPALMNTLGMIIMQMAREHGPGIEADVFLEVERILSERGTVMGQANQVFSLWKEISPEGAKAYAAKLNRKALKEKAGDKPKNAKVVVQKAVDNAIDQTAAAVQGEPIKVNTKETVSTKYGKDNKTVSRSRYNELKDKLKSKFGGKAQFSVIGEKGVGGLYNAQEVLNNLAVAKDMLASGKDDKTIKIITGWEKGIDEKWKYEIDDSGVVVKKSIYDLDGQYPSGSIKLGEILLSDMIDAKELFSAYPDLKNITVKLERWPGEYNNPGGYDFKEKSIIINTNANFKTDETKGFLLHEIQHKTQIDEGFANGSSYIRAHKLLSQQLGISDQEYRAMSDMDKSKLSEDAKRLYYNTAGEVEARNVDNRKNLSANERRELLLSETEDVDRSQQTILRDALGGKAQFSLLSQTQPTDSDLLELAMFHLEAGGQSFEDFADHMVKDLGVGIRPYLKQYYNEAAKELGVTPQTEAQVDAVISRIYAEELAARIVSKAKDSTEKKDPVKILINTLLQKVTAKGKHTKTVTDIEKIRDAVLNKDEYAGVWERSKQIVLDKINAMNISAAEKSVMVQKLTDYFTELIGEPFSRRLVSAEVGRALQGINLRKLLKSYYGIRKETRGTIKDYIIAQTGLPPHMAQELGKAIEEEYDARLKKELDKVMDSLKKNLEKSIAKESEVKGRKEQTDALYKEITELVNLGAFTDDDFLKLYAKKHGWKSPTKAQLDKLGDLANEVQKQKGMSGTKISENKAVEDLLAYQKELSGLKWHEIPMAIWYANVLSGHNTQIINTVSNLARIAVEIGVGATKNRKNLIYMPIGFMKGLGIGVNEAIETWKTGYSPIRGKVEAPAVLERKITGPYKYPAWVLKYVRRAMVAADVLVFEGASEMRAYQLARQKLRTYGEGDYAALNKSNFRKVQDILGYDATTVEKAEEYASQHAEKGTRLWKRLKTSYIHSQRNAEITRDAVEFGRQVTYNYPPEGVLGLFANLINQGTNRIPELKLVVPFTNIIANVANEYLNYTPIGLARAIRGGYITPKKYHNRTMTKDEIADLYVKAIGGMVLMITLAMLSSGDDPYIEITANGYNDYQKNKNLPDFHPYSFRIKGTDTWISYRYSPLYFVFAPVGHFHDANKYMVDKELESEWSKVAVMMQRSISGFFDSTFLSSVNTLMSSLFGGERGEGGDMLEKFMRNTVTTATSFVVPNELYQGSQLIADVASVPQKELGDKWYARLLSTMPFAMDNLNNRVDMLGFYINDYAPRIVRNFDDMPGKELQFLELMSKNKTAIRQETFRQFNGHGILDENGVSHEITNQQYHDYMLVRGRKMYYWMQDNFEALSKMDEEHFRAEFSAALSQATIAAKKTIGHVPKQSEIDEIDAILNPLGSVGIPTARNMGIKTTARDLLSFSLVDIDPNPVEQSVIDEWVKENLTEVEKD